MNIPSFLSKFRQVKQLKPQLTIVVQPSALFFSSLENVSLPQTVSYDGTSWQEALVKVLKESGVTGLSAEVVLHSNLYQTYQIDKPSIPDEELSSALPFLLKDLISERVTDIIADAAPSPMGNKLQVFVVARRMIEDVNQALNRIKIRLERVLVEDEVWAHAAGELEQFLLLQRSKQGQFKVSAFVAGQCAFQRTIRGVVAPITGVASSALQLDGLALELQRSIDYLSSQLRGTSLHQMRVCCDEEDQAEVAQALSERLSVSVAPLSEVGEESGALLVHAAALAPSQAVNLFPEQLRPRKEYFTLTNVMLVWGASFVFLCLVYSLINYHQTNLNNELTQLKLRQAEFRQQVTTLSQRLAKHKPTPAKVAAVSRLEEEIKSKQQSLGAVSAYDTAQQVGYSGVMRSLAKLGREDISLSSISINSTSLDIQGLAREPNVIPNWINQFKTELDLVGRAFEKLTIGRNAEDIITFELKTKGESK